MTLLQMHDNSAWGFFDSYSSLKRLGEAATNTTMAGMAKRVMEFSSGAYKIRKIFA
jgi:hypothetical protein